MRSDPNEARQATKADAIIGRRIKAMRVARHVSQDDLAAAIGVTYQQIQKYESGFTRVAASRLCDIAGALDCSPLELLPPDCPGGDSEAVALLAKPNALAVARAFALINDPEQERVIINLLKSMVVKPPKRKR